MLWTEIAPVVGNPAIDATPTLIAVASASCSATISFKILFTLDCAQVIIASTVTDPALNVTPTEPASTNVIFETRLSVTLCLIESMCAVVKEL